MSITAEDFLKLINSLETDPLDQETGLNFDVDYTNDLKISFDITDLKRSELLEIITSKDLFCVGDFAIKIRKYHGKGADLKLTIAMYETQHKTISGQSCNIQKLLPIKRDERFKDCSWIEYFHTYKGLGSAIPVQTLLDIIKHMQILTKLSAFA